MILLVAETESMSRKICSTIRGRCQWCDFDRTEAPSGRPRRVSIAKLTTDAVAFQVISVLSVNKQK